MQKKGELSRLAVNLLISSLIIILGVVIFIIVKGWDSEQEFYDDSNLDLKISQVKKINDNTLDLTLKRGEGEGNFVGLSFVVSDGSLVEVIRINTSMPENQSGNFSLNFISLNASRVKKISVTPIYLDDEGVEVIGNVKDEYITPNTCSNYCPYGAQCGYNDCGMQCGSGCGSGYLCLNYKCIKEKTSSGGGGGGSSGGSSNDNENETEDNQENETVCTPTTCLELSRTCGTVSDGCGGTLTCGSYGGGCQTGYSCQTNGTCIKDVVIDCGSVQCKSGEYCSNGVCLMNVTGNTYFVATNGNDNWPGNFTHPWATWEKAFTSSSVNAGDIVYFRGGVYSTTVKTGLGIQATRSGTENNWIIYMNYPGETPILDCGNIVQSDIQYTGLRNVGIGFSYIYYVKLVGLTVRNVKQYYNRNFGVGIRVSGGNMILERCTVYNIWGHGFETRFGEREGDKAYLINCDAYNCYDSLSGDPLGSNAGNAGTGFSLWDDDSNAEGEVYLYNCRAWNCSDQGFQTGATHYVKATGCWSFENKEHGVGGGAGWKMGWIEYYGAAPRELSNNLGVCNDGNGYMTNEWYGEDIPLTYFYHNLAYKNGKEDNEGIGIAISRLESGHTDSELLRILKNTISYDNYNYDILTRQSASYTHDHNSWDSPVNVTDEDFVSLDCSQLYSPRKADGSLPDITFGHLAQGSDLIDAGVVISGYHCATSGDHPGENCVEWYGSAPDLGPFESNY